MTTLKQELAAKKKVAMTIANGGKEPPMGKVMKAAGYALATTKNPKQKLTQSKAWPELLEKYLPDEKLLRKHDEALEATKWNDFTGEREPDQSTRLRGIELGYKVKGRLSETQILQQFNVGGEMTLEFVGKNEQ